MELGQPARPVSPEQSVAVARLVGRYAVLIDHGQTRPWAQLFGDSGQLVLGDQVIQGEDALTEFGSNSTSGTHAIGYALLSACDDGRVEAYSSFIFVTSEDHVMAGWYEDVLVPRGDEFQFDRRVVSIRSKSEAAVPTAT